MTIYDKLLSKIDKYLEEYNSYIDYEIREHKNNDDNKVDYELKIFINNSNFYFSIFIFYSYDIDEFILIFDKTKKPMNKKIFGKKMLLELIKSIPQQRIESERPKVKFFDSAMNSTTLIDMERVAKILAIKGMGRTKLFKFLRNIKILSKENIPYQEYINSGYFKLVEKIVSLRNHRFKIITQTMVFPKGLDYIRKLVQDWKALFKI